MSIGLRIKELRKAEGISQARLAESIGVSPGNVGEWELGRSKPGADALVSLSKHFNVSTDWLLSGKTASTQILEQSSEGLEFSPEEMELIVKFRQLNERQKGKIEGHIEALLGDTSENRNKMSSYSKNGGAGEEAATREGA
ncbi:MAG: helix-turn-helix domain-containing protein [Paenibacillus macerans]|uniref:helix-turn-helix domain-containing protein n=1 Tax=Paenibacillus macerans TaxID=44252 RepID=UPI001F0D656A|nr:helix-turn-helix domain-containing protein [Paenibacillus macerans]MDU5945966.1 helix-turn-helix domain-containing protein [Paenibacillus macerans]MDU7473588.1 helix-turn-helix domain-containing protein [Paenibacillus macerans]MEC0139172.1 helix-turn-helix domain-containing protein [Paenibacillus macerans]UMV47253.1 helix-turn-helix domain-containing protein [Paenibacillus macerans]